jgi:Phage tail lysozyme
MSRLLRNLALALSLAVSLVPPASLATTKPDSHAVDYDQVWYADEIDCATGNGGTAAVRGGDNVESVWNALIVKFKKPYIVAGIMGNMQTESGFDPTIIQGGGNSTNPRDAGSGGYGLVQWTPGSKLIPYLHGQTPNIQNEVDALYAQLKGVGPSSEITAGNDLMATTSVRDAAISFGLEYERYAGPPQQARIDQAIAILALAIQKHWLGADGSLAATGSPAPGGTSGPAAPCQTAPTGGNGDIVQTALGYAWPTPRNIYVSTPAYHALWHNGEDETDCGRFVAAVVHHAGVDPNYPDVGTAVQLDYVVSHPDKWQIISTNANSSTLLQPGDILVVNNNAGDHHTEIYTGGKPYPIAAASLGDHTPQQSSSGSLAYMLGHPDVVVARAKAGAVKVP